MLIKKTKLLIASLAPIFFISGCAALLDPTSTSISPSNQADVWYATSAAGTLNEAKGSATSQAMTYCQNMNQNLSILNTTLEKGGGTVTPAQYQFAFTCKGVNNTNAVAGSQFQYAETPAAPGPSVTDMANAYAAGANAANAAMAARGSRAATYAAPSAPVESATPTYEQNQNGPGGTEQFDRGLVSCITLGSDSSGYYFQNNCGVQANIYYACVDESTGSIEETANVNPGPGQRTSAPCYLPRVKTLWVACPHNDGIFAPDGHSTWVAGGAYLCKRILRAQ